MKNKRYKRWNIINGHKILSKQSDNSFLVECWNCKSFVNKNRANINKSIKCIRCVKLRNENRDISTLSWILWLKENTVRSRITRGMSIDQALYHEKNRYIKESFRLEDKRYLYKFNEQHYKKDKAIWDKAYLKYITKQK